MRDAAALDQADPLRSFRDHFELPERVIYLDGNSLGPLPRATPERIARLMHEEWGRSLIRAWNEHGWIDLSRRVGDKIGQLIGAEPGSTIVCDSTTINLFKCLRAAMELNLSRRHVVTETGNFPTDAYVLDDVVTSHRHHFRYDAYDNPLPELGPNTSVLLLSHVNYRTGAMHDMAEVNARAHQYRAPVLWDLSHSVGAVPLSIADDGADFAVGCGYKYLNGGPGAPAFLSVAKRHWDSLELPFHGWLGHADPFAFEPAFRPAAGVGAAQVGTPPILSLAALEVGVDIMLDAPIDRLREKSIGLTERFRLGMEQLGFPCVSPADPARRGSQLSFAHPHGHAIMRALIARGVIGDFRAPDVMRFGFAPLYLRYRDVDDALAMIDEVMREEAWRDPAYQVKLAVT
jgi:kynureninase